MIASLFRSTAVYGLGAMATSAVSFLLLPLYTRYLDPAAYGQLETLTAFGQILLIAFACGIGTSFFAVHFRICQSEAQRRDLLTTALFVLVGLASVQACLAWAAAPWMAAWLKAPADWLRLVIVTQLGQAIGLLPFAVCRSRQLPQRFILLSGLQMLGLLGLNVYHVAFCHLGVPGVLRSQLLVHGLTAIGTMAVILRRHGWPRHLLHAGRLLAWGMRHLPASLAGWTTNLSDRYFLLAYMGAAPLGVYALGYKLGLMLQMLLVMPLTLAWPAFAHQVAEKPGAPLIFAKCFQAIVIVACGLWVGLGAFAAEWVSLVGGPGYEGAATLMPIVLMAYALAALAPVLGSAIVIKQRYNWIIPIGLAVALANLGFNALLIPLFGTLGAAWATVLTFAWQAVLTVGINQRLVRIPFPLVRGLSLLGLAGGLVFVAAPLAGSPPAKLGVVLLYPLCVWLCRLWPVALQRKSRLPVLAGD